MYIFGQNQTPLENCVYHVHVIVYNCRPELHKLKCIYMYMYRHVRDKQTPRNLSKYTEPTPEEHFFREKSASLGGTRTHDTLLSRLSAQYQLYSTCTVLKAGHPSVL